MLASSGIFCRPGISGAFFLNARCCYSTAAYSMGFWEPAYEQIASDPISNCILPNCQGLVQQHAMNAFFGDKLLAGAAAKVLCEDYPFHKIEFLEDNYASIDAGLKIAEDDHWPQEKGTATKLVNVAFSNKFLCQHAPLIIPAHFPSIQDPTEKTVGSAVEAAVSLVHQKLTLSDSDRAIRDLARYLMERAKDELLRFNAKGVLLELGATFTTVEHADWLPENPLYESKATWGVHTTVAVAPSKLQAEQSAAQELLAREQPVLFQSRRGTFPSNDVDDLTAAAAAAASVLCSENNDTPQENVPDWARFQFNSNDFHLRNNESMKEWWIRGASKPNEAFRRVLMSHHVFPSKVQSAEAWTCRWRDQYLVVVALDCNGSIHSFLGSSVKSLSQARAMVGLETASYIKTVID